MTGTAVARLAKQRERIVGGEVGAAEVLGGALGPLTADRAHLPGGPVPGERVLLVFCNRVVGHAGKIIVRTVIFAHVIETEPPILVGEVAALRCTVRRETL